MLLSKNEILSEIKKGNIKIIPFERKNVGPCSIDLRLGGVFRRFKSNKKMFLINEKVNPNDFTEEVKLKKRDVEYRLSDTLEFFADGFRYYATPQHRGSRIFNPMGNSPAIHYGKDDL